MLAQLVHLADIFEEQPARVLLRRGYAIEIDVLGRVRANVGAHADQVALVGDDIDQLVAAEEAQHGRIGLAHLLSGLDRDRECRRVLEREAHHHVGDGVAHPVRPDQIDALELGEVDRAGLPVLGEVGLRAPGEVADLVDGDQVAVDLGPGCPSHIRCPGAIVPGLEGREPAGDRERGHGKGHQRPRDSPTEQDRHRARDCERSHGGRQDPTQRPGVRPGIQEGQRRPRAETQKTQCKGAAAECARNHGALSDLTIASRMWPNDAATMQRSRWPLQSGGVVG